MDDQIFISYSKKDRDFAWKLADDLVDAGHKIWIDRLLEVGEKWRQTIETKLTESDEVIVVLSSNAINSKWVQHEGSIAYGLRKRIYPVLIENLPDSNLPIWMNKIHYHRFFDMDYEKSFEILNAALTPKNPIRDLMDRKHYDFETNQLLMEPKELEIVAKQLNNPKVELSDADKWLLLYSGVAHKLHQPWLELAGERGVLWLREAIQDRMLPPMVRSGAVASLGADGDKPTYDQLSRAVQQIDTNISKDDALDMLSAFLYYSPVEFDLPSQSRWEIFLRMARLRVQNGGSERRHMKRAAIVTALICVMILFIGTIVSSEVGAVGDDLLLFIIFSAMGVLSAYIFAETITSLHLFLYHQRFAWRALALFVAGSIAGFLLFLFITGRTHVWVLGGFIGLVIAMLKTWQIPKPKLTRWALGGIAGILAAVSTYLLFSVNVTPAEMFSAALFTASYVFWSVESW